MIVRASILNSRIANMKKLIRDSYRLWILCLGIAALAVSWTLLIGNLLAR